MDVSGDNSEIAKFFQDRAVLLTGATGFVGKTLLEKLIRSCPTIGTVFILVRPKSGSDPNSRVLNLLDNVLFERVKKSNPASVLKIVPIQGDISLPQLGISEHDRKKLFEEVSVVFHSAASTNFMGKLKSSFNINVKGTSRLIELSKKMQKLADFVHISTAYANCDRFKIDEVVYPMSMNVKSLEIMQDNMSDDAVESSKTEIFEGKPNTYVFTKAMLECLVHEESSTLPMCIVRPSIVGSVWKTLEPGWADDSHGYKLAATSTGRGMIRTAHTKAENVIDVVPVDFLVSLILSAAWEISISENKALRLYNYCSGTLNPVTNELGIKVGNKLLVEYPISGALWYPHITICSNSTVVEILDFFQLYIPAVIGDMACLLVGRKRQFVKLFDYYQKLRYATEYFRMNEWSFKTDNMLRLYNQMSKRDQALFNFRVEDINWTNYIEVGIIGGRKHVLKENDADLESARARMKILYLAHRGLQGAGVAFVVLVLISMLRIIFNM